MPNFTTAESTRHNPVTAIVITVRSEVSSLHSFTTRLTFHITVLTAILVCLLKWIAWSLNNSLF